MSRGAGGVGLTSGACTWKRVQETISYFSHICTTKLQRDFSYTSY